MARHVCPFRCSAFASSLQSVAASTSGTRTGGLAAKLPDYYSFAIIAIMLHQYLVECPPIGSHTEEVIVPRRLNPKHIEALITDLDPVIKVDTALRKWLVTYNPPPTDKHKEKLSEVITLKAHLFRDSGKIVLKIGSI